MLGMKKERRSGDLSGRMAESDGLLQDAEMYGYEIVQAISARTQAVVAPGEGVVYPVLHALEKNGALKSQRREASGRSRVYYSLTSKGVRRLYDLTDSWTATAAAIQAVLNGGPRASTV